MEGERKDIQKQFGLQAYLSAPAQTSNGFVTLETNKANNIADVELFYLEGRREKHVTPVNFALQASCHLIDLPMNRHLSFIGVWSESP